MRVTDWDRDDAAEPYDHRRALQTLSHGVRLQVVRLSEATLFVAKISHDFIVLPGRTASPSAG